jgi:hypothetical protein
MSLKVASAANPQAVVPFLVLLEATKQGSAKSKYALSIIEGKEVAKGKSVELVPVEGTPVSNELDIANKLIEDSPELKGSNVSIYIKG